MHSALDDFLADEAALELGENVLNSSGAFIADTEEKGTAPVLLVTLILMRRIRTSDAAVEMLISRESVISCDSSDYNQW